MSLRGGSGSLAGLKIDVKRGSIAGIALGDFIGKVLAYIQMNYQTYGRIEIISQKDDARQPIFIVLPDSGFKLRFEPKHQSLELIELFLLSTQESKKRLAFFMRDQPLIPQLMNYSTLSQLMGPTYPPRIIGNSVLLTYAQGDECNNNSSSLTNFNASFVFMYNEREYKESAKELTQDLLMNKENSLVKINLQRDYSNFDSIGSPKERKVKILINEGLEIYNQDKEPVLVLFGDHLMDVLRLLGNPNKEYYNEGNLFLNYLELGFDIMVSSDDYSVLKFILHTNFPQHPHFGFYNRCFYELITTNAYSNAKPRSSAAAVMNQFNNEIEEEEMKESFFSNNDQSMISQSNKGAVGNGQIENSNYNLHQTKSQKKKKNKANSKQEKANMSLFSNKESMIQQNIQREPQIITPLTKFSLIKELFTQDPNNLPNSSKMQDQQFFVRNLTNDFTTHYHAYRSIIFEVMVGEQGGDYIASVTLFKVYN